MTALSTELVLTAGLDLVRDEGWRKLSIRAVAARLGVTPMALYRYVSNSETLAQGVITRIAERFGGVRYTGDTFARLERWARLAHDELVQYPGAPAYLLTTWFEVPAVLLTIERLLEIAHAGGLRDFEAVAAVNALFMYVLMRAEAEQTIRSAGAVKRSLSLANADLPYLAALSEHYTTARFDLHFDYGLRVLLDGIAVHAGRSLPATRGLT